MTWMNPSRTHDAFYLHESKGLPKESFVRVSDLIEEWATQRGQSTFTVADWGCAVGAFPDYLSQRFSSARVVGYEVRPDLVAEATVRYPTLHIPIKDRK